MMKTKQLLWTLSGIMMLGVIWLVLAMLGIRVRYVVMWFVLSIGPFLFWCSLLAIHLAMGWYVWRDARKRMDLLIGIPPWVWGLMGLTGGVLGLFVHWLANCCRVVKRQTIESSAEV